jgi:hypothetical protein
LWLGRLMKCLEAANWPHCGPRISHLAVILEVDHFLDVSGIHIAGVVVGHNTPITQRPVHVTLTDIKNSWVSDSISVQSSQVQQSSSGQH